MRMDAPRHQHSTGIKGSLDDYPSGTAKATNMPLVYVSSFRVAIVVNCFIKRTIKGGQTTT